MRKPMLSRYYIQCDLEARLEDWPDDDRRSRLVFVTRGLTREPVAQLFASVAAFAAGGA